jgi:hypothetical protein
MITDAQFQGRNVTREKLQMLKLKGRRMIADKDGSCTGRSMPATLCQPVVRKART